MNPKIRKAIVSITDFINRPMVRGFSKLSANVLNTIHLMKDREPMSMLVAGASLVNSLADSFDLPKMSPLEGYIKTHNLIPCLGTLSRLVYLSDYFKDCEKTIVFSTEDESLIELIVSNKDKFYIVEFKNQHMTLGAQRDQKVSEEFFFTKDFNFELLFDKIWAYYNNGIYLKRHKHNYSIELKSLPSKTPIYIGKHRPDEIYKKIKRAIDANISRSYLFNGLRGTGKTSCAMKIAHDYFKRTVKIDPAMARSLDVGELEFFVEQLRPDVLIFDDFDTAYSSPDVALFMLENLKQLFPKVVIFATTNDMKKLNKGLIRPGRFDQILWFGYPDETNRREILKLYFEEYNDKIGPDLLDEVCERTKSLTPAYLKELAIESRNIFGDNFDNQLFEMIDEFIERSEYEDSEEGESDLGEEDTTNIMDEIEEKKFIEELRRTMTPEEFANLDLDDLDMEQ